LLTTLGDLKLKSHLPDDEDALVKETE